MSVVGLTFGHRREGDPPERAERGERPDERDDPRVGPGPLVPREAARAGRPRGSRRPRAASSRRHLHPALPRNSATPSARQQRAAGAAEDPRRLGREVGPAAEHLGRGPSAITAPVGEQHHAVGEGGRELGVVGRDDDRGAERAEQRARASSLAARPCPGSARPGRAPRAGSPAGSPSTIASASRCFSPPLRSRGWRSASR